MKRAEANDPISIGVLGNHYHHGLRGFQQDHAKALNYTLGQQILAIVRLIITRLAFIMKGEI
jgi:hypothetical protein